MSSILDWIKAAFPVQRHKKDEVNFPCPYCGHESFYFNFRKRVGYCHSARCGRKPTLIDLVAIKGYGPTDFYLPQAYPEIPTVEKAIALPGQPIFESKDHWAIEALSYRGVTREQISKWEIRSDQFRIYVPVIEEGQIVQCVGRRINRDESPKNGFKTKAIPKYKYLEGKSISSFIFGWGPEMQRWSSLVLVENTFNAIAWRDKFNCSTNFGSHLSGRQIATIARSRIAKVVFAWDKDAISKTWDAAQKLNRHGIATIILNYHNHKQPDEVPFDVLEKGILEVLASGAAPYGPIVKEI